MTAQKIAPGIDPGPSELSELADAVHEGVQRCLNLLAALEIAELALWDNPDLPFDSAATSIFAVAGVRQGLAAVLQNMEARAIEDGNREHLARRATR